MAAAPGPGAILYSREINPPPAALADMPHLHKVTIQEITYLSDGLKVKGYLLQPAAEGRYPAVVFLRGGNGDFGALTPRRVAGLAARIASWGYVVVAPQYRGNGGGEGFDEFGGSDLNDVLNVVPMLDGLAAADASRIALAGFSRGGMMAYLALSKSDRFAGAAVVSGVSDPAAMLHERPEMEQVYLHRIPGYAEDPVGALNARAPVLWADRLPEDAPILIVHGDEDERVNVQQALDMSAALAEAGRGHDFHIVPGGDHGLRDHREELSELLRGWLDENLGRP